MLIDSDEAVWICAADNWIEDNGYRVGNCTLAEIVTAYCFFCGLRSSFVSTFFPFFTVQFLFFLRPLLPHIPRWPIQPHFILGLTSTQKITKNLTPSWKCFHFFILIWKKNFFNSIWESNEIWIKTVKGLGKLRLSSIVSVSNRLSDNSIKVLMNKSKIKYNINKIETNRVIIEIRLEINKRNEKFNTS